MSEAAFNVLTIGNAIVDIIAETNDEFLEKEKIHKGAMQLIDMDRAEYLYANMNASKEISGGSAGNTAAGIASLGGPVAYFGKVADDTLGDVFREDVKSIGVEFNSTTLSADIATTARSMIFVTPDGQRSMNTYLGACGYLTPDDIDQEVVKAAAVTYFEGYLWGSEPVEAALRQAADIAHANDRKMSMTLSDSFVVDLQRKDFLDLMQSGTIDIVFANEDELKSLYETQDFEAAVEAIRSDCETAAITRSEKGSMIVSGEQTVEVAADPIETLVDTTGAGDLYASGFLFGYTNGKTLEECGKLGSLAAGEVIQHIGARPLVSLAELAKSRGL